MLLARRAYPPAAVRAPSDPCACVDQPQHPAITTAPARAGLRGPAQAAACPRYALVTAWAGSVVSRARFVNAVAPPAPEEPPSAVVRALGCQCQRASPMAYQDRSRPRGQSVKPPLIGRRAPGPSGKRRSGGDGLAAAYNWTAIARRSRGSSSSPARSGGRIGRGKKRTNERTNNG